LCLHDYLVRQLNGDLECNSVPYVLLTQFIYLDWFNIHSLIFCLIFPWCLFMFTVRWLWFEQYPSILSQPSFQNTCCIQIFSSFHKGVLHLDENVQYVCGHQYFVFNPVQCKLSLALFCLSLNYIDIWMISTLFRNDLRAASINVWDHDVSF